MECYDDMIFCGFHNDCAISLGCARILNKDIIKGAKEAGEHICQFSKKPKCFVKFIPCKNCNKRNKIKEII